MPDAAAALALIWMLVFPLAGEPVAYESVATTASAATADDVTVELDAEQTELMAGDPDWRASARLYHARKMMDYGLSNIALGTNLEEPEDIELSLTGIWLRVNDKINRLKNLLKRKGKNYVEDEPMIDSFLDIANYGIIAMLVMKGKWKK